MRTIQAVDEDLKRLGRPMHPGVASITNPGLITRWRAEVAAWRLGNPGGEERYCLLLEERELIETAHEKARAAANRARELGAKVGIPKSVRDALANPMPRPVLKAVDAWVESGKTWLVLAGSVGTGKSVAAGHALMQCLRASQPVAWVLSAGFAAMVGGFERHADMQRLKSVDVLVIDDFGTEHWNAYAESLFNEVLIARHEERLRTIITTNLKREEVRPRLGSRLADRVASDCDFVEVTGESMRRGAA